MKNIRLAEIEDIPRLNEIWALCFGDGEKFRNFYFRERFQPKQTLVYLIDDLIVAMLTMIPVNLWQEEESLPLSMFYAIATHPEYQQRGIATKLMDYATDYQKSRGTRGIVIVPASGDLFPFYLRQGYEEFFAIREKVWEKEKEQGEATPGFSQSIPGCKIEPITPKEYNEIRNKYVQENFLVYRDEEVAYQKSISRFSGVDIYSLNIQEVTGCAAVERLNEDTFLFKELLLPPELVDIGIKGIGEILRGRKFLIRTPIIASEKWDESCRPFGVLKWLTEGKDKERNIGKSYGYLGLAFD
ncbi:MAG: GNAT family N-acetyltransferase [Desulfitobacterium sp.]|nr:GNAT family N-acetyltransferase [Desulfitobacterium sp.]